MDFDVSHKSDPLKMDFCTAIDNTPHHTTSHHTTSHHITPLHTTLDHTRPHHTTPNHTTPHHTTSHHITPHHTTPHHTTPHPLTATAQNCLPHIPAIFSCKSHSSNYFFHNDFILHQTQLDEIYRYCTILY